MVRKSERTVKTESVFLLAKWLSEKKKRAQGTWNRYKHDNYFLDMINQGRNEGRFQDFILFLC